MSFLWDYLVGGKCVNDPLMTPDKKEWMDCSARIAKYTLINAIFGLVIVITILIFVLPLLIVTNTITSVWYLYLTVGIGALVIGSVIFNYITAGVTAESRWDAAETKVRAQLTDVMDDTYFTNYEKYDEAKKKEVKTKWLDGAKKIREIENEQTRVRAAETQAYGMAGVGFGQTASGVSSLATSGLGIYNTFRSNKK